MSKNLKSIKQFLADNTAFTNGGLRALIFNKEINGLQSYGVIVRLGRKILIDEDKFFNWLESKQNVAA